MGYLGVTLLWRYVLRWDRNRSRNWDRLYFATDIFIVGRIVYILFGLIFRSRASWFVHDGVEYDGWFYFMREERIVMWWEDLDWKPIPVFYTIWPRWSIEHSRSFAENVTSIKMSTLWATRFGDPTCTISNIRTLREPLRLFPKAVPSGYWNVLLVPCVF